MSYVHKVGTVTLLFTDLVGSTEMLERLGDDEADRLRRTHFGLLRAAVAEVGGEEVKNLGDGLMVVFPSALDAVACAIRMQQTVHAHNQSNPELQLSVRIGLHGGDTLREEDDYFGRPVVVAKRLCDSAVGGQILVSDLVENMVGRRGRFEFRDLGWIALKGLSAPMPAREVLWDPADERELPQMFDLSTTAMPPEVVSRTSPAVPGGRRLGLVVLSFSASVVALIVLIFFAVRSDDRPSSQERRQRTQTGLTDLEWQRVDDPAVFVRGADQQINRVEATDTGLIAVGFDTSSGDKDAAVWTSFDGTAWQPMVITSALGGSGDQVMWGVKSFKGSLIAVGQDGVGGESDGAIWISDGVAWKRLPDPEGIFGGPGEQVMNRVVAGGLGIVAIGYDSSGGDKDAAVWTSANGRQWVREAPIEQDFGGEGAQEIRSIMPLSATRLVAVGLDEAGGDQDAAVWISDTRRWKRIPHDESVFGGEGDQIMTTVVARDGLLVAVGSDSKGGDLDAAIWTSTDGESWTRVPESESVFGGPAGQASLGVEATGLGFVAVGHDNSHGDPDVALWFSSDGRDWERAQSDPQLFGGPSEQVAKGVVATEGRLVVVGWDSSSGDFDAAVWTTELPRN